MGFYYFSLFSWMAFGAYFAMAAGIIVTLCNKNKLSPYWKAGLLTVAFIAPWTEELWIAYNFGQLCGKDAGKFIYKTVEVHCCARPSASMASGTDRQIHGSVSLHQ